MLGKLVKYEIKATARIFLPLYAILLVIGFLNRILSLFDYNFVDLFLGISSTFYVLMIIALFAVTFFVMVIRYYKTIFTDEGYLQHTLPVKSSTHILAKFISSSIWTLSSIAVCFVSLCSVFYGTETMDFIAAGYTDMSSQIQAIFNVSGGVVNTVLIAALLIFPCVSYLMFYSAITIGSLFGRNKLLGSFIAMIGIYFAGQISSLILLGVGSLIYKVDFFTSMDGPVTEVLFDFVKFTFLGAFVINILFLIAHYFISTHILNKKLNID